MNVTVNLWLALLFSLPYVASAVKMDETTHDMVIQRLEMGLSTMDKSESERPGIQLRLADLLADRARLKAMNQMDQNCTTCKGAREDRDRAIALYNEALPKAEKDRQGPVVLQIAHLHALNEQTQKSAQLYNQILKARFGTYSNEVISVAHASLGEQAFRRAEFKEALKHYQAARRGQIKNKGMIEYRMAWCQLNLGQTKQAIRGLTQLLENQELLATQTTDGKTQDPAFAQDVSRDLAKFMARDVISAQTVERLRQLSPTAARKQNLYLLATEADRLGKKSEALQVWAAYVDEAGVDPNEKLEVQIRVARIQYDLNRLDAATLAFEKAMDLWRKQGCSNNAELCEELKKRSRQTVTAWNKAQKQKPTQNLFRVYVAYTQTFADDVEMMHWGAVVGRETGNHKQAAEMFHRSAGLAHEQLSKDANNKSLRNIFEGSLLGEIEMAEAQKSNAAKENAYNYYLKLNPEGAEAFRVRYQRAQVFAESNRHREAFSEFHFLATQPGKEHRDLKVKSADLALDSLVALKDDQSLQVRPLEYARIFPERKLEYLKISRKATLTLVAAKVSEGKSTDRSDYKASLAALKTVNLEGADEQEKIKFFKNKLVIAQKALDLGEVRNSANTLLRFKSLKREDQEWCLEQKVWAAELELNFAEAYALSRTMKFPHLSKADRELRLALLAELSGRSAAKHHQNFLKLQPHTRAAGLVRVTMIRESNHPWRELERHKSALSNSPDLLAGIALETFARSRDNAKVARLLKTTAIGKFPAGQTLARQLELKEYKQFEQKIAAHQIYGYSDRAMQKTLKERLKLISQAEKWAGSALNRRDWTMQTITLAVVAKENRRLYNDINRLPVPQKLSAEDKKRYLELLKTQSAPYLAKAEKIEEELGEMWSRSDSMNNLQAAYVNATPELQAVYRSEIQVLAQKAPDRAQKRLLNLLNTPYRRPRQRDVMIARRELQMDPMNISKAEALRELESQNGSSAMVAYLDERIQMIKKGKSL